MDRIIGDNRPPPPAPLSAAQIRDYLDYEGEPLRDRRAAVVAALQSNLDACDPIADDDTLGVFAENMRMARALCTTAEDRRVATKAPFLEGGRCVDGWFKQFAQPIEAVMAQAQAVMDRYGDCKLSAAEAEAEAELTRLSAVADDRLRAAHAALSAGQPDAVSLVERAALATQAVAEAQARRDAKPADLTRSYGDYGAVASVRQSWTWEITDFAAIPRHFLCVDDAKLKVALKERDPAGRPRAAIPGVRWIRSTKIGVR